MTSSSADTMLLLRAQINGTSICVRANTILPMQMLYLDNFRYIHRQVEEDHIVAIAKHDNLCWVVVAANDASESFYSTSGSKTEEAALQKFAGSISVGVWNKVKENGITLPKQIVIQGQIPCLFADLSILTGYKVDVLRQE
jgi:hypothetical protein